ncbi:hypothetical protein DSO57_1038522 [Entomophthora muscae]|uniref:Uncharacterized protein n=1 Tax=Entomophthora muscae TaxID=34485 RepID=A0ACC2RPT6_9FUNG|nr:hypothetical protein DSO57_1038522 [Entomophthora muscae]
MLLFRTSILRLLSQRQSVKSLPRCNEIVLRMKTPDRLRQGTSLAATATNKKCCGSVA